MPLQKTTWFILETEENHPTKTFLKTISELQINKIGPINFFFFLLTTIYVHLSIPNIYMVLITDEIIYFMI